MDKKILVKKNLLILLFFAFVVPVIVLSLLSSNTLDKIHPRFIIQKLTVFSVFLYFMLEAISALKADSISQYLHKKFHLKNERARYISKFLVILIILISTLICLSMIYDIFITIINT